LGLEESFAAAAEGPEFFPVVVASFFAFSDFVVLAESD